MSKKTAPDTGATERAAERGEPIYERILPAGFLVLAARAGLEMGRYHNQPSLAHMHVLVGQTWTQYKAALWLAEDGIAKRPGGPGASNGFRFSGGPNWSERDCKEALQILHAKPHRVRFMARSSTN